MATGDSYATLGIGISCCHMTQGDSKFHPWFKCIYIVGVFFIVCVCGGGGGGGGGGGVDGLMCTRGSSNMGGVIFKKL